MPAGPQREHLGATARAREARDTPRPTGTNRQTEMPPTQRSIRARRRASGRKASNSKGRPYVPPLPVIRFARRPICARTSPETKLNLSPEVAPLPSSSFPVPKTPPVLLSPLLASWTRRRRSSEGRRGGHTSFARRRRKSPGGRASSFVISETGSPRQRSTTTVEGRKALTYFYAVIAAMTHTSTLSGPLRDGYCTTKADARGELTQSQAKGGERKKTNERGGSKRQRRPTPSSNQTARSSDTPLRCRNDRSLELTYSSQHLAMRCVYHGPRLRFDVRSLL